MPSSKGETTDSRAAEERVTRAAAIMTRFAERTGVGSQKPRPRYLWTDAFAVCNFLGLARRTDRERHEKLAQALIHDVHHQLGRHRDDDPRSGWLSGLDGEEAEAHPTRGGLRIGKELPERKPDQPVDQRLEWDRDGQYFHYLTKWMHALDLAARTNASAQTARWARELAEVAFDGFTYQTGGQLRMYWKMSIDLSRPLVPSMGHHDPLDGFVTYAQLQATASELDGPPRLDDEIAAFSRIIRGRDWTTSDPLGLGGLLMDAYRVAQLHETSDALDRELLATLLGAVREGLEGYAASAELERPAAHRLAFRELGLAIGLWSVTRMSTPESETLRRFVPLRDRIVSFWLDSENQAAPSWGEHRDINEVMLATALVPAGCLELPSLD